MKFTSCRRKDQAHVLDMISLRIIDDSWLERFSPVLRDRLLALLNTPEGEVGGASAAYFLPLPETKTRP